MYQSAQEFISIIEQKKKSRKTIEGDFYRLLDEINHPELSLKCLHVAGTNGKGSTTNYLRSILQENGYKVGSFTSPHLVVHNDRIRINDVNISDKDLLELANKYEWAINKYDLSMFEIDMLLSIDYFIEKKVDYVVYEVGMGGRLDSTNVINPLVSIITNIGFDHMQYLGNTLKEIAYEKAGIIKERIPIFTTEFKEECLDVFKSEAIKKNAELFIIPQISGKITNNKLHFDYLDYSINLDTIALYQCKNASLALSVAIYLMNNNIINLSKDKIIKGLENTFWKGRFEILKKRPLVICDGAHNEHGVNALIDSLVNLKRPLCIIASILKDKQYQEMLKLLEKNSDELIVTTFENSRASSIDDLAKGINCTNINNYQDAIKYALNKYQNGSILLTGSLYFVSEIRNFFEGEK